MLCSEISLWFLKNETWNLKQSKQQIISGTISCRKEIIFIVVCAYMHYWKSILIAVSIFLCVIIVSYKIDAVIEVDTNAVKNLFLEANAENIFLC